MYKITAKYFIHWRNQGEKVFDVKSGKYIYNGKFTELAKDSSVIGDVGNKSVALKALDSVNAKISEVIASRLAQVKN